MQDGICHVKFSSPLRGLGGGSSGGPAGAFEMRGNVRGKADIQRLITGKKVAGLARDLFSAFSRQLAMRLGAALSCLCPLYVFSPRPGA